MRLIELHTEQRKLYNTGLRFSLPNVTHKMLISCNHQVSNIRQVETVGGRGWYFMSAYYVPNTIHRYIN